MAPKPAANDPIALDEKITRLLNESSARGLTPLQAAFTGLTWAVVVALLISVGFIAWAWYTKLPPVPPLNATAEEISQYRELTDIADQSVTELSETVTAKVLFPILTLVAGVAIGRAVSVKNGED